MKREILFRGKKFRGKKWVYGSLRVSRLPNDSTEYVDINGPDVWKEEVQSWRVDPDTVGQYIGLKDALGRKIFEGDIFATGDCMMFVTFKGGEFVLEGTVNGKTKRYPMTACYDDKEITEIDFIVIGNIYDNPELIGGDEC